MLTAVANPLRLRVIAELSGGRVHVSELARRLGISRPLLYMHLDRLEKAGIVTGQLELSEDGKAMKYFELAPFELRLTADVDHRGAADRQPRCRRMPGEAGELRRPDEGERHMTGIHTLASGTNLRTRSSFPSGYSWSSARVVAVIVASYFRLQGHRADAVAMAPTASWPRKRSPTSRSFATSWQS